MQRLLWIALTIEGFNEADMYTRGGLSLDVKSSSTNPRDRSAILLPLFFIHRCRARCITAATPLHQIHGVRKSIGKCRQVYSDKFIQLLLAF